MRHPIAFLLALLLAAPCLGQARPTRDEVGAVPAAFRLTKHDGSVVMLARYRVDGRYYVGTDVHGTTRQFYVDNVKSLEPLDGPPAASPELPVAEATPSARTTARTAPRTTARTTPRESPPATFEAPAIGLPDAGPPAARPSPGSSTSSRPPAEEEDRPARASGSHYAGYTTATGIPMLTGPRGGTYHLSKSGKKDYHKPGRKR